MSNNFDVAIIGTGVVGLATAYQLQKRSPHLKVALIEKENDVALHQTGRNSGVIHSGIYYKPGSLKAVNCLRGYNMIVEFAREHHISFELCGKIIVAANENEIPRLDLLYKRGQSHGLKNLKWLDGNKLNDLEPHVSGKAALHIPQTGIIDYKNFCNKVAALLKDGGATFFFQSSVKKIISKTNHAEIISDQQTVLAKRFVNAAGLYSDLLGKKMTESSLHHRIVPFRGEYYKLKNAKKYLVKNLIYPVPDLRFPFLGVHFTRMTNGDIEVGPNAVLALAREAYTWKEFRLAEFFYTMTWPGFWKFSLKHLGRGIEEFHRSLSKKAFTRALQQLIPEIDACDLEKTEAGVRAQACSREGQLLDDFLLEEGPLGLNVYNAPSPAATASLSIGDTIAQRVLHYF